MIITHIPSLPKVGQKQRADRRDEQQPQEIQSHERHPQESLHQHLFPLVKEKLRGDFFFWKKCVKENLCCTCKINPINNNSQNSSGRKNQLGTHTHTHTHTHPYTYTHTYTHTHTHTHTHAYTHAHAQTWAGLSGTPDENGRCRGMLIKAALHHGEKGGESECSETRTRTHTHTHEHTRAHIFSFSFFLSFFFLHLLVHTLRKRFSRHSSSQNLHGHDGKCKQHNRQLRHQIMREKQSKRSFGVKKMNVKALH